MIHGDAHDRAGACIFDRAFSIQGGFRSALEPCLGADYSSEKWCSYGPDQYKLCVEMADHGEMSVEEIDRDFAALATLCAASEPADEEQLEQALHEVRRQAKEQVRRHMGLE